MISPFEYVTVLMSIILGLGISQILTGVADLFHKSQKVRLYWPHTLWVLFVLVLHIQEWWVTYELKTYPSWRLPVFLFIMLYPINLFVLARMLFPLSLKGKQIALKDFYLKNYRKIFLLFTFSGVLSALYNLFVLHMDFPTQILQVLLVLIFISLTLMQQLPEWVHKGLSLGVTVIMIISIVIEWNVWLIG